MAEIVYDLTFEFVKLYVDTSYRSNMSYKVNRQADQMLQAARSGKQNISEGSQTSGTSKQSELRLVDVARASMEELLVDYQDFLRVNNFSVWPKDDLRSVEIRKLAYVTNRSYTTYRTYMTNPETAANCLLCVINQTNYLLDQQLRTLQKDLVQYGDFKDRHREIKKQQMFNGGPSNEEFLTSVGMRRLPNGKVVGVNDEDE